MFLQTRDIPSALLSEMIQARLCQSNAAHLLAVARRALAWACTLLSCASGGDDGDGSGGEQETTGSDRGGGGRRGGFIHQVPTELLLHVAVWLPISIHGVRYGAADP